MRFEPWLVERFFSMVLQSLVFIFNVSVAAVGGWFWKQGGEIVSKLYVNMLDMTSSYC